MLRRAVQQHRVMTNTHAELNEFEHANEYLQIEGYLVVCQLFLLITQSQQSYEILKTP